MLSFWEVIVYGQLGVFDIGGLQKNACSIGGFGISNCYVAGFIEDNSGSSVAEMSLSADEAVYYDVADVFAPYTIAEKVGQVLLPVGLKADDFQSRDVGTVKSRYIVFEYRSG